MMKRNTLYTYLVLPHLLFPNKILKNNKSENNIWSEADKIAGIECNGKNKHTNT